LLLDGSDTRTFAKSYSRAHEETDRFRSDSGSAARAAVERKMGPPSGRVPSEDQRRGRLEEGVERFDFVPDERVEGVGLVGIGELGR
jgi:hypothetical protein